MAVKRPIKLLQASCFLRGMGALSIKNTQIKALRTKGLERRADNPPPLQSSGAWSG